MASPLEGRIAKAVARGFKGKLKKGTLRRVVPGVGVNDLGDPLPGTAPTWKFEGIRENYDAAFAATAMIPVTDVRVLVIAGSLKTDPRQGDQVFIESRWHEVKRIEEVDPAGATYKLQCFEIADPT